MSHTTIGRRAAPLSFLLAILACGGGDPSGPGATPVATVSVSPPTAKLAPQATVQLTAVPKDADGAPLNDRMVSWISAQPSRASVDDHGMVTGLSAGPVTITATSEGKSGSAQITVEGPVASVAVSAPLVTLVPQQTTQLSAALQDAGGAPLGPRPVSWNSSQTQVASVDNNGRVTAHTAGSTTITAVAEGKQGTLGITVLDGALMGPAGGTVTMDNGAVTLTVPAGAVPAGTAITLVPVNPSGTQPANVQLTGAVYRLGPPGLTFAQPATVTIKYNTANFPAWAMAGDLTLVRNTAGQWGSLSDIAVDVNAGTVSGKTTGIPAASQGRIAGDGVAGDNHDGGADHSVGALPPQVNLTPGAGSVNAQQRSVRFHAGLVPRGGGVSMPATTPANTPQWKFRWRTTGQNGVLGSGGTSTGWTTNPDQQYIATVPVLNDLSGQIDMVFVDVLLNPDAENNPSQQRIVTAQAAIDADLQTTYEISPDDKTIGPSASANFQLVVRDRQGNVLQPLPGSEFTWQGTSNHGSLGPTTPTQAMATYNSAGTFNFPPPRVDEIKATVEGVTTVVEREVVWDFSEFPPRMVVVHHNEELRELRGEAKAFVTVKVDYTVKLEPVSNNVSVGGNKQLQVVLDPPYNGPGLEYKYTNSAAHGDLNVANGVRTASKQVTYTAKQFSNGGTDQLEVEVVSVVAGVQLESLGKGNATVEVDPWRNGFIGPAQQTTEFGTWFTSAQIRVAKVAGATQYEVKAETPDGLYTKTFGGATSSNPFSVNEVLDGGTHWLINIEAGFNSIQSAADARWNIYFNKYKDTVVRYKATQ